MYISPHFPQRFPAAVATFPQTGHAAPTSNETPDTSQRDAARTSGDHRSSLDGAGHSLPRRPPSVTSLHLPFQWRTVGMANVNRSRLALGTAGWSLPQKRQTRASFLIASAQCGHLFRSPSATPVRATASESGLRKSPIRTPRSGLKKKLTKRPPTNERPLFSQYAPTAIASNPHANNRKPRKAIFLPNT